MGLYTEADLRQLPVPRRTMNHVIADQCAKGLVQYSK